MHTAVFKLAVAVIVATAVFFLLAANFSELADSANASVSSIEGARRASLNKSMAYLQR